MDTRTGEVMPVEEVEYRIKRWPEDVKFYKPVPYQRIRPKTGRNEPCPCGSGEKFKKCCLNKETT
jgi:uncharacterized protein YecA (UPF0149 family)